MIHTRVVTFVLALVAGVSAYAQVQTAGEYDFQKVSVAGAVCADGSAYSYYVRAGDPNRVLVNFQGGGACWDRLSCDPSSPFSHLSDWFNPAKSKDYFTTRGLGERNPFAEYTYIFLPYCTADIFGGAHVAQYAERRVRHVGHLNVVAALAQLAATGGNPLAKAGKVVIYGSSAGAIGAMLNVDSLVPYVRADADKTMIIDSPGLHFSWTIWKRFSKKYIADLRSAMDRNGMSFNALTGLVSLQTHKFCETYPTWKVGFIQSTQDRVMSSAFGNRTPGGHRRAVLGPWGLPNMVKYDGDACSAWIPDATRHVWAVFGDGWRSSTRDGKTLRTYVLDLLDGKVGDRFPNYK